MKHLQVSEWKPRAPGPQEVPRITLWRYQTIELSHSFVPCEAEALENTSERESYKSFPLASNHPALI